MDQPAIDDYVPASPGQLALTIDGRIVGYARVGEWPSPQSTIKLNAAGIREASLAQKEWR